MECLTTHHRHSGEGPNPAFLSGSKNKIDSGVRRNGGSIR